MPKLTIRSEDHLSGARQVVFRFHLGRWRRDLDMRHERKLSQLHHTRKNQHAGMIKAGFVYLCLLFSGAVSAEAVQLAWDPVQSSQVAVYQVHYGPASGQYNQFVESATNSASIQGLQPGSTYFFAVRACDSSKANCSGFSNEVSTTLPAANNPPNAVNDLSLIHI